MAAREMGGQFRREQIGVAAGYQKPESLSLQAIDKHFPARKILDLVKKQIARLVVHGVYSADNFIVIFDGGQPFVIEVDVAVRSGLLDQMGAIKRFPRTPRTGDDFDQIVSEVPRDRYLPVNIRFLKTAFQFSFLKKGDIS